MDEEEENEDVDLTHTPLYRYMQDCGLTSVISDVVEGEPVQKRHISSILGHLKNLAYVSWKKIKSLAGLQENAQMDYWTDIEPYAKQHRDAILRCNGLVEEDATFLENVFNYDPRETHYHKSMITNGTSCSIQLLVIGTICNFGIRRMKSWTFNASSRCLKMGGVSVFICVSGYLVLLLQRAILSWRRKKAYQTSLLFLKDFLFTTDTFLRCIRQCLRFMQEFEVIGKGLLLSVPSLSLGRLELSGLLPQRSTLPMACQCTSLRICLFTILRKQFRELQSATHHLMKSYPLRAEIDSKSHYIARMDEETFGPLVTTPLNDKAKLIRATNYFSISAMKSLSQLHSVQLSEFLRRLALCFYQEVTVSSAKNAGNLRQLVPTILRPVQHSCLSDYSILNESFEFNQMLANANRCETVRPKNNTKEYSPRFGLATAVKSLNLHLKVSMARSQEFMDALEKLAGDPVISDSVFNDLSHTMKLLNHDLQASKMCYEETWLRLIKFQNKENAKEKHKVLIIPKTQSSPSVPVISTLERLDLAPEDQIFEMYMDKSEDMQEDQDNCCDSELLRITNAEREISARMFSELKTVLVSKAAEWKAREARAGGIKLADDDKDDREPSQDDSERGKENESNVASQPETEMSSYEDEISRASFDKFQLVEEKEIPDSCPRSIAEMAVARSKMWNLASANEEYFGSDAESDSSGN